MLTILLIIIAYLFGSLSSAIIACKVMNLPDPRTQGSGNPGATNVLRIGGKQLAALVLLCDALKGVVPVILAKMVGLSPAGVGFVALAAFLGHLFPVFFGFRGGKGVATALGSITALAWPAGLAMIITWLVIAGLFRYSSLAGLVSAALAPFYICWLGKSGYVFPVVIMVILLFWRHQKNILQLYHGKESKMGKK